ncbi:MAG: protoheme IX farnesyltransferase [Phycisphaerales bacterium]|nr:protoheme IX farnesyltransferase [Phycisphaerales bacterium]
MKASSNLVNLRQSRLGFSPSAAMARLGDFYELTKLRMNFLVVATAALGFYMAADTYNWGLLLATLIGTSLSAGCATVFNQLMERQYDALMPRTHNRPLPANRISPTEAALWAVMLGVTGVGCLALFVNLLTAFLSLLTILLYVLIYTPMKRTTSLCTIVGAIPGAIPPVMGWTAYHNALSFEAVILFLILFIWQMPHFLAIAVLYKDDYNSGGYKMLPCVDDQSLSMTSHQVLLYLLALLPISLAPAWFGMTGSRYMIVALILGLVFLGYGLRLTQTRTRSHARKLFFTSIIYLPLLMAVMMLDRAA